MTRPLAVPFTKNLATPLTMLTLSIGSILGVHSAYAAEETGVAPEVLFKFTGETGDYLGGQPLMPPMLGKVAGKTEGYLYGAAGNNEGNFTATRVYRLNPENVSATYTSADFNYGNATGARATLIEDAVGNIYTGMMKFDFNVAGYYAGQYAKINPDDLSWEYISQIPETPEGTSGKNFVNVKGEQTKDADGNIYFPAKPEGAYNLELLVRMDAETGTYTVIRDFGTNLINADADRSYQITSVIFSEADNALYTLVGKGRTNDGETKRGAILVKIPISTITDDGNSPVDVLYTMDYEVNGFPEKAMSSQSTLLEDGDFIYGTTYKGETAEEESAEGTVWRFNKTSQNLTVIHYFGLEEGDGIDPYGTLAKGADGNIYGTTDEGGINGDGTLFRINVGAAGNRSDDSYELLHSFTAETEGSRPTGLIDGGTGILYGSTRTGGAETEEDSYGTVYKVEYPLPEVSFTTDLSTSATSVETGDSITLTWAAENAGTCTAGGDNGDVWTGEKAASGTDVEVTLTKAGTNTFNLSCETTYEGGDPVSSSTVTVEVTEPVDNGGSGSSSSSGGGAFNPLMLLPLGLLAAFRRRKS